MCTLIAFHRVWADAPLVVAVNRDEAYDRPSSPPRWWDDPPVLAPRDEEAGGTWMGANREGLWVGITNRRGEDEEPGRRSRGMLCLDLLDAPDSTEVTERIATLEEPYNPFHLVAGDGRRLLLIEYEGGESESRALAEGVHLVTNRPPGGSEGEPKVDRARALLGEVGLWPVPLGGDAPPDLEDRLGAVLADHGRKGSDALCLHGGRYGTRSAAVWRIRPPGDAEGNAEVGLAFADGPPCSAGLEKVA